MLQSILGWFSRVFHAMFFPYPEPVTVVTVTGIVYDESTGKVAVVHLREDGKIVLPGGIFEPTKHSSIVECLVAEMKEELGLDIEPSNCRLVLLDNRRPDQL